jgi:FKBP-type peptidyl-prolyl cis-trans isomerase SlyD
MTISKNTVVTLHYKLQEESAAGELIEETFGKDPLVFLYGAGQMIPEFESQLAGKKTGDAFGFNINSEDAYGDYDPQAVVSIPKDTFVVDGKLDTELLQEGKMIPMRDPEGNQLLGTIMEIQDAEVVMDFNHPMAGVDLYFTVSIEDVREATASEIDHGHVHGAGGHQH